MKAFLLAAGRGVRFRPVTESIPKPLFPFANVPLIRARLEGLFRLDILEAGVNLHHLGEKIERHLRDRPADLPEPALLPEPEILGTAGALRNAAGWLADGDFLVVNTDTVIEPDIAALFARHIGRPGARPPSSSWRTETPDRYTPLQAEGDRNHGLRNPRRQPAPLHRGLRHVPRVLARILSGEAALVADLWDPLLRENRNEIGWLLHRGPFADLGRPQDFLQRVARSCSTAGTFPGGAGEFDAARRVLAPREDRRLRGLPKRDRPGRDRARRGALRQRRVGWRRDRRRRRDPWMPGRRRKESPSALGTPTFSSGLDSDGLATLTRSADSFQSFHSFSPRPEVERANLRRASEDAHDGHPVPSVPEIDRSRRGFAERRERAEYLKR